MKTNKYKITLTPVDKFFFGGDMTFSVATQDKKFNDQYASYIIQSSKFPQQTSLLGMLRFLILRNAGEKVFSKGKIVDKSAAEILIGGKSFSVNSSHEQNQFGVIQSISHVKLYRTCEGKSVNLEFSSQFRELDLENTDTCMYGLEEFGLPHISKEQYNAKAGLDTSLTDGEINYQLDKIFVEDRRIGIDRDIKTGKTKDKALFKQISYRFNNKEANYCFSFEAEIDEDIPFDNYNGQMVSIGGDNSQFIINISNSFNENDNIKPIDKAVYLLSPTFLTKNEVMQASFAITELIPFRFLESKMKEVNSYHILSKELKRSRKYELYAPGSIFYFKSEEQKKQFITFIESKKEFRQIGYNAYK